jgi:hypothetical protein
MVTPSPRLPGLNGLKLQFHCVPCSLEIVRVPLGAALAGADDEAGADDDGAVDDEGDEGDDDGDDVAEEQAATATASSAAAPVAIRRLIPVVLH